MTILGGSKLDAADFGGIADAWTTYTPTLTNVTGGSGTFAYMIVGKTLFLRGQITAGTATAAGIVSVTLPAGVTLVAFSQPLAAARSRAQVTALANSAAGTVELSNADGTNYAAAAGLSFTRFQGVLEIA